MHGKVYLYVPIRSPTEQEICYYDAGLLVVWVVRSESLCLETCCGDYVAVMIIFHWRTLSLTVDPASDFSEVPFALSESIFALSV